MTAISEQIKTQQTLTFDLNSLNNTTATLNVDSQNKLSFQVITSGSVAICTLQVSLDGTNWFDTSATVTGEDLSAHNDIPAVNFARIRVSTAEGGAETGTVDITATSVF